MKTLDAKTLKARKDNLHAEYEAEKQKISKIDAAAAQLSKNREAHVAKMVALEGAYQEIEKLEKELGIDPLSTRVQEGKPGKKK